MSDSSDKNGHSKARRKIMVTSALLYANGPLHIGHLLEYIQADIWHRFQKLQGHDSIYLCGSDAHGTPIMLTAKKQGIEPHVLVAQMNKAHQADFLAFHVHFDNFYTTHSPENQQQVNLIYAKLKARGDIDKRTIEQAYDEHENLFLPDRFVKGLCPRCEAPDQYGDNCEVCGATYSPTELKKPYSILSGTPPIRRLSDHYFFRLDRYESLLREWIKAGHLQDQVAHKLTEWFEAGLKPWDISRDAPYFGFEIPDAPNKYFYVWLDAPVGYMASLQHLCDRRDNLRFDDYWSEEADAEIYHFIGKDIIYFHGLFWPAILSAAGFRQPTALFAHGFLTVNGKKMSKSRGTFVTARAYLEQLDPEYLRYYLAAKLSSQIEDVNFSVDDFVQRVNTDLIGKVINIASRCAGFIQRHFEGRLSATMDDVASELWLVFEQDSHIIAGHFESRNYHQAIRVIMGLADKTNQYIDRYKPWSLAKENPNDPVIQSVCSLGINAFRWLMVFLSPILPATASRVTTFLNEQAMPNWEAAKMPLLDHTIRPYQPLMQRVDKAKVLALIDKEKEKGDH